MFQVIDMHCDTIPALQWKEKQEHLADADLQINLDKLEKGVVTSINAHHSALQ